MASTRTDTTVIRGPCAIFFNSAVLYAADKVDVKTTIETFQIPTAHAGPLGQRVKQIRHEISFTPAGAVTAGALTALFPHTSATPGASAMPATAQNVIIWPLNGKEKVQYENGFVSKMPDLLFSAVAPLYGPCTITCIGKDNTAWSDAAKQLTLSATAAFTDTSFSLTEIQTVPYAAAFATLSAPWAAIKTKKGFKVSFNVPLDEDTFNTDAEGIIDVLYKDGASLNVKFEPIGVSVTDLHALLRLQGTGAARGMEVQDLVKALTIDGGVGFVTATFNNLQLLTAPSQFKTDTDRVPELDFVATRKLATGGVTLDALFSIGIHAA
jgi:hypothetical protein